MNCTTPTKLLLFLLTCLAFSLPADARDVAGKITFLKGEAWVQQGVARQLLDTGSIIYSGDQIRTGADSNLYLRFLDKTFFALGPQAKMDVETYNDSDDDSGGFAASILRGAFRFVSGLLASEKPEKFTVRVSVGTIGVRGTHVAGEVFERQESDSGVIEASANVMLLEDEDGDATAIEVSNQYGSVVIDEPGFGTEIPDEHSPPSPVRRMQIRSINNLMRAIRNTTRRKLP